MPSKEDWISLGEEGETSDGSKLLYGVYCVEMKEPWQRGFVTLYFTKTGWIHPQRPKASDGFTLDARSKFLRCRWISDLPKSGA